MTTAQHFGHREAGRSYQRRLAAYAVILDEKLRVACVVDKLRLFLPGGGLEAGEGPRGAVQREVAEECARSLEVISPLDSAIQFFHAASGEAYELHAHFFLARFGGVLDGPAQHELRWLPVLPQPPAFFHECHRWAVQQALSRNGPEVPLPMSNKVLASLENSYGDYCVDIFARPDGSFGFEEYRRDPEDGVWRCLHRYAGQVFKSQEAAVTQAKAQVPWLKIAGA